MYYGVGSVSEKILKVLGVKSEFDTQMQALLEF